jgi:hypothetical protein
MQHISPHDEDRGILSRLTGGDVSRALSAARKASPSAVPGDEHTALIGTEWHGPVRVTCRLLDLKRGRNRLRFWCAISAEPR